MAATNDVQEEMTFVTADIIFRTLFSRPLEKHEAELIFAAFNTYQEAAYAHGLNRQLRLPEWMSARRYRGAQRSASVIRGILDPIVAKRHASFHAGEPQTHYDILQSLISVKDEVSGTHFNLSELCEQVSMLFLAGHETRPRPCPGRCTYSPETRRRRNGQGPRSRRPWGHAPSSSRISASWSSCAMSSPRACGFTRPCPFCRARRRRPAPSGTSRRCPARSSRSRRGWSTASATPGSNPDSFDPDRFGRPDSKEAERHSYIPFSKGPRVCLGAAFALQEATLILASLVRRYHLGAVEGFSPQLRGRLTVRSLNGIRLRLRRRTNV